MNKPAVAIVGPTACGKTRRGVALALHLNGEIVSADSRQIYRGMDVGTGKDLADYPNGLSYHMIDIAPAGYKYNLYEYLRDAHIAVDDIRQRGKLPVIVGGTGLYVESLLKGMVLPEVPANTELRERLRGKGLNELADMLAKMKTLHNNTDIDTEQRAIRAIEIEEYYLAHPDVAEQVRNPKPIDAVVVGIDLPRDVRRQLITQRLHRRLRSENMLDEVKHLLDSGIAPEDLIYYGLEYKFLTQHVIGELSREEMESQLEIAIHQFAKRQMTWFRGMERRGFNIHWLPYDMPDDEFVGAVTDLIESHE